MEDIRNQSFPLKTKQEWTEKAEQSLKGRSVESLQSTTYENIILKPLYTREDEQLVLDIPGGPDFRRGIYPLGYVTNEWKIAQSIPYESPEELKTKLAEAVEKGQTAISFELSKILFENQTLSNILLDFYQKYPLAINTKWLQTEFLESLAIDLKENEQITGYAGNDPISLFAEQGVVSENYIQEWVEKVNQASKLFPRLRTVLVDTTPYHNGGANAVQELAIAVAEGVFYLQLLIDSGMDVDSALSQIVFHFSIGSQFFTEVAKLRAARVLWNKVGEVYGADESKRGMHISATTSSFTKAVYDRHVNLLRTGSEAFAAVLGGVQYLQVDPFDVITGSNSFSERIARNIPLILKEEAQLQKVIDPAGGSWYVEELTNQTAEKAWEFFQQIEAEGGMIEVLKSNWLQEKIAAVYTKRNQDVQTRKLSIVGTNVYAQLEEIAPEMNHKNPEFVSIPTSWVRIKAIPQYRLAEPFEELRRKAKTFEKNTGIKPAVGMICLGELKQHKPRLDFMKAFLAAGGIDTAPSGPIYNQEEAREFVAGLNTNYVSFCGTNEQYESFGHEILSSLKTDFTERTFFLAGLPEKKYQEQWVEEGLKAFIHVKSNCYETTLAILSEMEVAANEKQKA